MSSHDVGQAKFVKRFFEQSRLHFIGTWRERYEGLLKELSNEKIKTNRPANGQCLPDYSHFGTKPLGPKTREDGSKVFFHVDLDAFFVSASTCGRPSLQGIPVVTTHSRGKSTSSTSEVSCANYLARSYGIKAGMSLGRARVLCNSLQTVPYEFDLYISKAEAFYRELFSLSPFVMAKSCDEAIVDVTHIVCDIQSQIEEKEALLQCAEALRSRIFSVTEGCTASIGIGNSLFLAKISSRKAKPDGVFYIDPSVQANVEWLNTMPIEQMPGIGYSTRQQLLSIFGVSTFETLQRISLSELQNVLGQKKGEQVFKLCHGQDIEEFVPNSFKPRQSISAQISWGVRMETMVEVEEFMKALSEVLASRLLSLIDCDLGATSVTLTIWKKSPTADPSKSKGSLGHGQCAILSRSLALERPTRFLEDLFRSSISLFRRAEVEPGLVRGIGISCGNFQKGFDSKTSPLTSLWSKQEKANSSPAAEAILQKNVFDSETAILEKTHNNEEIVARTTLDEGESTLDVNLDLIEPKSNFERLANRMDDFFSGCNHELCERNKTPSLLSGKAACLNSFCEHNSTTRKALDEIFEACVSIDSLEEKVDLVNSLCDLIAFKWPNSSNEFRQGAYQILLEFGYLVE